MLGIVVFGCFPSDRGRDRRIPGAHWPASLAKLVSSRPMRDPVSKEVDSIPEDDTQVCSLVFAYTCAYICVHTHRYMSIHTCTCIHTYIYIFVYKIENLAIDWATFSSFPFSTLMYAVTPNSPIRIHTHIHACMHTHFICLYILCMHPHAAGAHSTEAGVEKDFCIGLVC